MRPRPKPSERVLAARKERNRLALRWGIAVACSAVGVALGILVWVLTDNMEAPGRRPGEASAGGLANWWFTFAQEWRWALGSATSGFFGVLLPALSYPDKRKQAATQGFAIVVFAMFMMLGPKAVQEGLSFWEVVLPGMMVSLAMNMIIGYAPPPDNEDTPRVIPRKAGAIPPSPPSALDAQEDWVIEHKSTLEQVVEDRMAVAYAKGGMTTEKVLGVVGVLFVASLLYLLLPKDLPYLLPVVAISSGLWIVYRWVSFARRKRKSYENALAPESPETFAETEVWTLREDGLHLKNEHQDSCFYWKNLQVFDERNGGIYLEFHATIGAFIPDRAFANAAEKRRWRLRIASHFPEEVYPLVAKAIEES